MKLKRAILTLFTLSLMVFTISCNSEYTKTSGWRPNIIKTDVSSSTLNIEKIENLSDEFILGMDTSCVPALEAGGVKYYDQEGNEKDVFEILSENGINYIRVRIWNDPFTADGKGYGGGNCDIENAINIGKRASKYGLKLLVNFHYSDFWADPAKQKAPKAWAGMSIDEKSDALYNFTKDCLKKLCDEGVSVGMVQIGNETNGALCGETGSSEWGWQRITQLMSSGSKAVREVCPDALVALHFTNPEKTGSYQYYCKYLEQFDVDYDVFASSYYPYWHGTLDNLSSVLSDVAQTYNKKVMIAETSYAYTPNDSDYYTNTIGAGNPLSKQYPFSLQGQTDFLHDLVDTAVNKTTNCIGVFYWEGTWISAGGASYSENSSRWEEYGSGWASSFAAEYDPDDAGKWYGGCAVDNQAFFDSKGRATEALKAFALFKNADTSK